VRKKLLILLACAGVAIVLAAVVSWRVRAYYQGAPAATERSCLGKPLAAQFRPVPPPPAGQGLDFRTRMHQADRAYVPAEGDFRPQELLRGRVKNPRGGTILEYRVGASISSSPDAGAYCFYLSYMGGGKDAAATFRDEFDPQAKILTLTVTEVFPRVRQARTCPLRFRLEGGGFVLAGP